MRYTIIVSKDVENELRSTYDYIAKKNKKAAKKFFQKVEKNNEFKLFSFYESVV